MVVEPTIMQPSVCFLRLFLTENTNSLVNFNNNFLNIELLQRALISLYT